MYRTIGTIARQAGVGVETVRYYERIGLLARPRRIPGRIRQYPVEALDRLRFIKRAQWLGFSLDEVAMLLSLGELGTCPQARTLAETKADLLRRKLKELAEIQAALEALISECTQNGADRCPLLDTLSGNGPNLPEEPAGDSHAHMTNGSNDESRAARIGLRRQIPYSTPGP